MGDGGGGGGFQVLLLWKGVSSSLAFEVLLLSSKKYLVSRMRREKSYMSAETSGQLIVVVWDRMQVHVQELMFRRWKENG